jgi:ParB family chromosome partitioning protein
MKTETATEYRSLPLSSLTESKTNPRRIFEDAALEELADFVPGNKICLLFR